MKNLSGANLNNGAAVGPQGEGRENSSSFPRYLAYKDSGAEWLGEVPEHWGVSPLKWLAEQVTDKATTSNFQVGLENIEGWTGCFIETDTEFAGDGIAFRQKDILFGKLRPYLAKVWLADKSGQAVGDFFVLRPRAINSEFIHKYILMPTVIEGLNASTIGAKMPRVGWEDMAALAVTIPPHKEQTQIARFLDHETARIDALIEEQQRLIELLKEKRKVVISHAVTKGLEPTVPMKDSGVEWLGEVPAHWEVRKLSTITNKITNGFVGPTRDILVDEGIRYLQSLHIKGNRIKFDVPYYVREAWSLDHKKSILESGDVLIVQTGDIGQVAVVTDEFAGCNCHALIVCSPVRDSISGEWLSWVLNTNYGRQSLLSIQTGALHPHLNCGNVKDLYIPVPPLAEQEDICKFVEGSLGCFDSLISESESAGLLLRERRSALISAAVTGKIDVRGWQPPTHAQSPELAQEVV
ncbi:restriction endonuclease subunit S [Pseudomonas oryzihabitans]|uniref:restriction endonuclease subunit S n=1 Tax=Pseudomonas oryzihabitans TaxID=47885 RepID=UPI00214E4C31|nr:restriction endonuclease subunit S [Pseudomonas psychrotolerans]UUW71605.1 restriction endonuclease subunit S [Pseudomonas psychrotolerans]